MREQPVTQRGPKNYNYFEFLEVGMFLVAIIPSVLQKCDFFERI